jgi:lipopolysaccharide transport system ATP-binding protein
LPGNQAGGETIWALDDVSFEIKQGQVVGIIGRNGAGKSTLLKVLSRITEPTRGVVDIWGRVGSLLEVGTGFHPELTGRENVYLNGAILGMHREEIARKFDEIVEFAEIEKFIDTPVKFYSTGMYLRLAFSVAAHLEPDILLIDEILAVGDAAFQKKCLGKMGDVAHQGRTVLFVSHQMNAIRELCPNCMWLDRGRLIDQGESARIVAKYLSHGLTKNEWTAQGEESTVDNPYFNPLRFCIVNQSLEPISHDIRADEDFGILIEGEAVKLNSALTVGFAIFAPSGELMFWSLHTDVAEQDWPAIEIGKNCLVAWIPPHLLNEGDYRIEMIVSLHFKEWIIQPGVNAPSIGLSIRGGLSQSPHWIMARPGTMAPVIKFERV